MSAKNAADPKSPKLVPTGIAGLDEILLGGVNSGNIVLVEGAPGSGKTTLGLEFIYRAAKDFEEPCLIVTFELSPQKLLRDASGFGWDFESLEKKGLVKIIYTSPSVILDELQSPDGVLATEINGMGATRVLIDGLSPLRIFGEALNRRSFRDSLHLLVESLQRFGVTAMLTNEVSAGGLGFSGSGAHERFVCDTIVTLGFHKEHRSLRRTIEIVKSRGQDYIGGEHTMKILPEAGIEVYRRTQSRPKEYTSQGTSTERISIGEPEIDRMLGGGLYRGSITLVVGISGTGKTVTGTQFLMEGVKKGEQGLLVTLDEHPLQMTRNAETLGFPFRQALDDKSLVLHYSSPLELELDVHFDEIVRVIEANDIRRVVIDSLAAYETANPEEAMSFIYALASFLKNKGIAALFNYESPELLGVSQISEDLNASHLVDNIVLLNYIEIAALLRRSITISKVRGSDNIKRTQEFLIGKNGMHVVREEPDDDTKVPQLPFSAYYGILARSPARKAPAIEGKIANGDSLAELAEGEQTRA